MFHKVASVVRGSPAVAWARQGGRRHLSAAVLSGTSTAAEIRAELKRVVDAERAKNSGFKPGLAIVQVGGRRDSSVYVGMKKKAAEEIGLDFQHLHFGEDATEEAVRCAILGLNRDPAVHGVLLQLPIPAHMDHTRLIDEISPSKDVDGFNAINTGHLARVHGHPLNLPCTPKGCLHLIKQTGVPLDGKQAVVIGRSDIVGTPMGEMLKHENCTVTICHSHTADIAAHVRGADIVVAAVGRPEMVKKEWIKPGAVVIDVGINAVDDDSKRGYHLVGDVDYAGCAEIAGHITPVPGGVGPMTVAMLMDNTVRSALNAQEQAWRFVGGPVKTQTPTPNDMEISTSHTPMPISMIMDSVNILRGEGHAYGEHMAKIDADMVTSRLASERDGNYICVAGITPTPLGEGKSTLTIGLAQAFGAHLNVPAFACVRQPSQGPTFGIKGGAAGGGYSQIVPMDDFNLHLTGDIHAISAATNLMAAAIDARYLHEGTQSDEALFNRLVPKSAKTNYKREFAPIMLERLRSLGIDKTDPEDLTPEERSRFARLDIDRSTVTWRRVVDVNDRFLRNITVGEAEVDGKFSYSTGYDISVASEIMAILALSSDLADMRKRLGKMVFGADIRGNPLTANDIGITGALTVLMKEAIKPTLMQTLEGTPTFVHAGPFANIAHGNSSVIADRAALKLVGENGFVITEAGFGADIGLEKFFDIKCRNSGLLPSAVVICATVRALKMHGGGPGVTAGKPLAQEYVVENIDLVSKGMENLERHIQNVNKFGVPVVIGINRFSTDTDKEIQVVKDMSLAAGARDAVECSNHAHGGKGAVDLAESLVRISKEQKGKESGFRFLYDTNETIEKKIESISKEIYRADGIEISDAAKVQIERYEKQGYGNLPICMAKTHLSFSADPQLKGAPTGFNIPIREVRLSAGAGFLYPLVGKMQTMPGLPTRPAYYDIDIDLETNEVKGLF